MRILKLFQRFSFLIYFLVANLYFILSNIPLLILFFRTPKGFFNPLNHLDALYDYNVYLSAINQGIHGAWFMRDAFTSEATNPTLFYWYYVLIGKIFGIFHLSSPLIYHLNRVLSAELFIIIIWVFCRKTLGRVSGFWASIFSITATIAPIIFFREPQALNTYSPWWIGFEAVRRMNVMPHYLFGYTLELFSSLFVILFIRTKKIKYIFWSIPLILLGGIIFPPSLLPVIAGLPLSYGLFVGIGMIKKRKLVVNKKYLLGLSIILPVALISLLAIWHENYNGFPWDIWNKWEIKRWNIDEARFNYGLLLLFGFMPLFSLPAIFRSIVEYNWEKLYLTVWALLPYLLLPFIGILGVSKYRLVSFAPFIPFAALSASTIFDTKWGSNKRKIETLLVFFFLLSAITVSAGLFRSDISKAQTKTLYTNLFYSPSRWRSIVYLQKNAPADSVIVSDEYVGNILPAYASVKSFYGHPVHTRDFFEKAAKIRLFLNNKMTADEAKNFIGQYGINYIYFGPDERYLTGSSPKYSFLKEVYNDGENIIFHVDTRILGYSDIMSKVKITTLHLIS